MFGIIASIIDGVLVGLVYGLAAMGLTLIWGVMDVINLTHGTMIVAGMMVLYLISGAFGISPYFTLPPILIGGFFVGVALYWIAVHRMMGRPPLMSLLSTFSVNLVLVGLGTAVWGTALFNVEVSLPGLTIDRYTFPGPHILGVALAGVSGMLIGTLFPFTILSGDGYQLKSFVVTVLGGFGNPVGALMGGVALGLLEGAVTPFVPVSWTLVIEFVLFVLVLIAFPGGVFARRGVM